MNVQFLLVTFKVDLNLANTIKENLWELVLLSFSGEAKEATGATKNPTHLMQVFYGFPPPL